MDRRAGLLNVGVMSAGGRVIGERAHRHRHGTSSLSKLRRKGLRVKRSKRKARYFTFRGPKKQQALLREAIRGLIKPYPKRVLLGHRLIGIPGGKAGPGRGNKGPNVTRFQRGNSRAYTLARLTRDHPDLAIRVHAGELSAHAAAIAAGWRRKQAPKTKRPPPPRSAAGTAPNVGGAVTASDELARSRRRVAGIEPASSQDWMWTSKGWSGSGSEALCPADGPRQAEVHPCLG